MNMITGLNVGTQTIIPGGFLHGDFEVTYGLGHAEILPALLIAKAEDTSKVYGENNPSFKKSYSGFAYGEDESYITSPVVTTSANANSGVGSFYILMDIIKQNFPRTIINLCRVRNFSVIKRMKIWNFH